MACRFRACLRLLLFTFSALLYTSTANAHFNLNLNVRIIHVEHQSDGMNIYMRLPMPYLVAHLLGEADADGLTEPAPYTTNRMEDGKLVHYIDAKQLKRSAEGLASLARNGLVLTGGGNRMELEVERKK